MKKCRLAVLGSVAIAFAVLASGCGGTGAGAGIVPAQLVDSGAGESATSAPTALSEDAGPEPAPTSEVRTDPSESADANQEAQAQPSGGGHSCVLVEGEPGPVGDVSVKVEVVAEGLEVPWGIGFLPGGDILITERPGRVRLIRDGELVAEPVLEIEVARLPPLRGIEVFNSEGGLLGLLMHPGFESNRQFYIFYNTATPEAPVVGRIARYVLSADGLSASLDRVIVDDLPAGLHHQGGRMHIGPDGMLYVGVGAYDPWQAQDPDSLAGKLLRMDLEGGIPADNPDPESYVYASGIRNTQGFAWLDADTLVMVDHGPSGQELGMPQLRGHDEVTVVRKGDNLGWPEVWGCDEADGLSSPVLVFEESVPPTGAIFYRGDDIPEWTNSFLFTAVGVPGYGNGQHLHRVVLSDQAPYEVVSHEVHLREEYGRLRTIAADPDGVLHLMTSNCDGRGRCPASGDLLLQLRPSDS